MCVRPASALLCVRLSIVKQWRAWPPCRETGKNNVSSSSLDVEDTVRFN